MIIDGVLGSECVDSSGEVLDVAGADISDWEAGTMLLDWEHEPGEKGASTIVGKVTYAKKIFKKLDCENERQEKYWNEVRVPFIYGVCRLFDTAGHVEAQNIAAIVRDCVANNEMILVRYSVEGSTLQKDGNVLTRTCIRRVAVTVKPCNRTAISGLLRDDGAPDGFKKEPEVKAQDILDDILETKKFEHPMYARLAGSVSVAVATPVVSEDLIKSMVKAKMKAKLLEKALTAGGGGGAPSTLTGGAALQREDLRRSLVNVAKAAARDYRPDEDGDFKKFLKSRMPEASDEFIDHFAGLVDDFKAKLKKAADSSGEGWDEPEEESVAPVDTPHLGDGDTTFDFGANAETPEGKRRMASRERAQAAAAKKAAKVPREPKKPKPPKAASGDEGDPGDRSKEADDAPIRVKKAQPPTVRGQLLSPNPDIKPGDYHFNEDTGQLDTSTGTLHLWNPDTDTHYGMGSNGMTVAGETFRAAWDHPDVRAQHDYAVENWIRVHEALKNGTLPEAVVATATAFSQLSPNTPVPVHEMMYAYLLDSFKHKGMDLRDPSFGHGYEELYQRAQKEVPSIGKKPDGVSQKEWNVKVRAVNEGRRAILSQHPMYGDWISRDQAMDFPDSSQGYFMEQINRLISNKKLSDVTGRGPGEHSAFMLGANKFRNMAQYHSLHSGMVDLVARHGIDARTAAAELMDGKGESKRWQTRRKNTIARGQPDIGEFPGVSVPGLAPKTARFTYAMLGGGNVFVPDTHFSRHLFGLDKALDAPTIALVRNKIMWGEQNSALVSQFDKWYFHNHPAVQLMLNHEKFGEHFRSNPEQAIFPAFWGHWLAISKHEQMLGHRGARQASNQSASHRPVFEEVARLSQDPEERKKTIPTVGSGRTLAIPGVFGRVNKSDDEGLESHVPLLHPIHAAYLLRGWHNHLGPAQASFRFFTHLVPLLMAQPPQSTSGASTVRKMEALTLVLRKAAAEAAVAAATPSSAQTKPEPDSGRQKPYRLEPETPSSLIDANVHGIGHLNNSDEQNALIHGMDVSKVADTPPHTFGSAVTKPTWMKTASGKHAIVKQNDKYTVDGINIARREMAYHNMARDVFGMGHYVPTTAIFRHPTNGNEYSAQEMVPASTHSGPFDVKDAYQRDTLFQLHGSGEIDKLRIMNSVLGNNDRHYGNFVFTKDTKGPPVRMIDHGHTFRYAEDSTGAPDYARLTREMLLQQPRSHSTPEPSYHADPIHPAAAQWLQGLDANSLKAQFAHHQFPDEYANHAITRLQKLKERAHLNRSRYETFNSFLPRHDALADLTPEQKPGTRPIAEPGTTK